MAERSLTTILFNLPRICFSKSLCFKDNRFFVHMVDRVKLWFLVMLGAFSKKLQKTDLFVSYVNLAHSYSLQLWKF